MPLIRQKERNICGTPSRIGSTIKFSKYPAYMPNINNLKDIGSAFIFMTLYRLINTEIENNIKNMNGIIPVAYRTSNHKLCAYDTPPRYILYPPIG
jgi:hypothetical protein